MRRNRQAVGRTVKGIFAADSWLKADKGMIGFRKGLRPDLHIGQGIIVVNRQFLNYQCAAVGYLDSDMMREGTGIIRRVGVPVNGTGLKAWDYERDESMCDFLSTEITELKYSKPN